MLVRDLMGLYKCAVIMSLCSLHVRCSVYVIKTTASISA